MWPRCSGPRLAECCSVDATKDHQQIVARCAGPSSAIASAPLRRGATREAATVFTTRAPAAAGLALRLRSSGDQRLRYGCMSGTARVRRSRFPARETARPVGRRPMSGPGRRAPSVLVAVRKTTADDGTGLNSAFAFQGSTSPRLRHNGMPHTAARCRQRLAGGACAADLVALRLNKRELNVVWLIQG